MVRRLVNRPGTKVVGYFLLVGILLLTAGPVDLSAQALQDRSMKAVETIPDGVTLGQASVAKTPEVWTEMIRAAEDRIRIGSFYLINKDGSRFDEIIELITQKARSGVDVRIVVDAKFYETYSADLDQLEEVEGIEVRLFDIQPMFDSNQSAVMHAKYLVVDEKEGYVGSANFDWRSHEHIREAGVVFRTEQLVQDLIRIFKTDWELAGMSERELMAEKRRQAEVQGLPDTGLSRPEDAQARLVASSPRITPEGIMRSEEALLRMIKGAEDQIFIDLYKYNLWDHFNSTYWDRVDRALRRAESRGVEIKIQTADWGLEYDAENYLKSLSMLEGVQVQVLRIPQAREGYIPHARVTHSKIVVVDGRVGWIGSTNMSYGYFNNSRNVDVVTWEDKTVEELRRFFLTGWQSRLSTKLHPTVDYEAPYRE